MASAREEARPGSAWRCHSPALRRRPPCRMPHAIGIAIAIGTIGILSPSQLFDAFDLESWIRRIIFSLFFACSRSV